MSPVTNVKSEWSSGSLIFFEKAVGRSTTGDILTIGTASVIVGNSGQDVDLKVFLGGASNYALFDCGNKLLNLVGVGLVMGGVATGLDHPINLNSILAMTGDETTDCGNVIKINRSAGAIGGTHSGIICKHYISGGVVDGTAVVSGLYVNLKYEPTSENAAAEVSLIETHLYSDASDAIDYGWYCLAPASKISALLGVTGTMTNFLEVKASGDAGMTVSANGMVKDPESDTEAGYLTAKVEGGASYQIPMYAVV